MDLITIQLTVWENKNNFPSHTIKMFGYMNVALQLRGGSTAGLGINLCSDWEHCDK